MNKKPINQIYSTRLLIEGDEFMQPSFFKYNTVTRIPDMNRYSSRGMTQKTCCKKC